MQKITSLMGVFMVCGACALLLAACGGSDASAQAGSASGSADGTGIEEPAALVQPPLVGTNVGVNAGYAGNGVTLDIPSGFTAAQCRFTAALATQDGKAISAQASVDQNTGTVKCRKVVQEREEVPPTFQDCIVSFTVVCAK